MKNAGRYWLLLAGVLFLLESSCSTMRPMPEMDYRAVDPARNKMYRLTTLDKQVYDFKKFAVTDSTLVILEVESYRSTHFEMSTYKRSVVTPVVIRWDHVKSFEISRRSILATAIGITAVVVVGGSIAFALLIIAGPDISGLD
jgi:hypothetical protein